MWKDWEDKDDEAETCKWEISEGKVLRKRFWSPKAFYGLYKSAETGFKDV